MHGQHHPLGSLHTEQMPHQGGSVLTPDVNYLVGGRLQLLLHPAAMGHDFLVSQIASLHLSSLFSQRLWLPAVQGGPHHFPVKGTGNPPVNQYRRSC